MTLDMASVGQSQAEIEKELKFAKLEGVFYKACNAVRCQGLDLRDVRYGLLQELLEIEGKKNSRLSDEIQRLQIAREEDKREITRLKGALKFVEATRQDHIPVISQDIQDVQPLTEVSSGETSQRDASVIIIHDSHRDIQSAESKECESVGSKPNDKVLSEQTTEIHLQTQSKATFEGSVGSVELEEREKGRRKQAKKQMLTREEGKRTKQLAGDGCGEKVEIAQEVACHDAPALSVVTSLDAEKARKQGGGAPTISVDSVTMGEPPETSADDQPPKDPAQDVKRKRGRPRKNPADNTLAEQPLKDPVQDVKKKCGRPRKYPTNDALAEQPLKDPDMKRKRGRPRKCPTDGLLVKKPVSMEAEPPVESEPPMESAVGMESPAVHKKYILRWPGLADHLLVRSAKLDALAVLRESETKRLLKCTRILSPKVAKRGKRRSVRNELTAVKTGKQKDICDVSLLSNESSTPVLNEVSTDGHCSQESDSMSKDLASGNAKVTSSGDDKQVMVDKTIKKMQSEKLKSNASLQSKTFSRKNVASRAGKKMSLIVKLALSSLPNKSAIHSLAAHSVDVVTKPPHVIPVSLGDVIPNPSETDGVVPKAPKSDHVIPKPSKSVTGLKKIGRPPKGWRKGNVTTEQASEKSDHHGCPIGDVTTEQALSNPSNVIPKASKTGPKPSSKPPRSVTGPKKMGRPPKGQRKGDLTANENLGSPVTTEQGLSNPSGTGHTKASETGHVIPKASIKSATGLKKMQRKDDTSELEHAREKSDHQGDPISDMTTVSNPSRTDHVLKTDDVIPEPSEVATNPKKMGRPPKRQRKDNADDMTTGRKSDQASPISHVTTEQTSEMPDSQCDPTSDTIPPPAKKKKVDILNTQPLQDAQMTIGQHKKKRGRPPKTRHKTTPTSQAQPVESNNNPDDTVESSACNNNSTNPDGAVDVIKSVETGATDDVGGVEIAVGKVEGSASGGDIAVGGENSTVDAGGKGTPVDAQVRGDGHTTEEGVMDGVKPAPVVAVEQSDFAASVGNPNKDGVGTVTHDAVVDDKLDTRKKVHLKEKEQKSTKESNLKGKVQKTTTELNSREKELRSMKESKGTTMKLNLTEKKSKNSRPQTEHKSTDVSVPVHKGRPPKKKCNVSSSTSNPVPSKTAREPKKVHKVPDNPKAMAFYGGSPKNSSRHSKIRTSEQRVELSEDVIIPPEVLSPSHMSPLDSTGMMKGILPTIPEAVETTDTSSSLLGKRGRDQSSNEAKKNKRDQKDVVSKSQANSDELVPREWDGHEVSPEIPLQNTSLTISLPITTPSSSHKIKKRKKTLESVLSNLLESKLSKNGEIDDSSRGEKSQVVKTVAETGQREAEGSEVGGTKKDRTGPIRKRKTLVGRMRAREKTEKLSVVADEKHNERSSTIRINTSTMVAPKLKSNPVL